MYIETVAVIIGFLVRVALPVGLLFALGALASARTAKSQVAI